MLKDTKSLGNNKAPACESRGFVLKKEGVLFDTPSKLGGELLTFLCCRASLLPGQLFLRSEAMSLFLPVSPWG